jgi:hypothetical protein
MKESLSLPFTADSSIGFIFKIDTAESILDLSVIVFERSASLR